MIPVSTNVSALPADAELTRETSPSLSPSASPLEPLTNNSTIGEMGPIAYWPYFVDFGTLGVIDSLQSIPVYMTTSGSSYARIMSTRVDSDNTRNNITVHLLRNVLYAPKLKPSKMCDKNDLTCMAIAVGSNSTDRMLRTRYLDQVVSSNRQLVAYVDFELTSTISGFVSGSVSFAVLIGDGLNPINVSIPFRAVLLLGGIGLSNSATHFVLPISNRTYFPHPFDPSYQTSPGSAVNIINGKQFCGALQGDVPNKTGKKKGKKSIVVSEISRDCVVNGRGDCVGNSDRQILLSFTNYYDQPLLLVDASVSSCGRDDWPPLFSVTHIDRSMVAKGGEKWPDIELQFDMKAALLLQETYPRDLPFVCYLSLRTSVSEHMIPLFVTDGAVKLVHVNAVSMY